MAESIQPAELAKFLELYGEHFSFRRACREIGRARSQVWARLKTDPDFKRAFDELRGVMAMNALDAVYERGIEGVETDVHYQGIKIATEKTYSDSLALVIVKALLPEFRDKATIDHTNSDGSMQLSEAQIMGRLESLLSMARARRDRGEVIDAEIVAVPALPKPEDLL